MSDQQQTNWILKLIDAVTKPMRNVTASEKEAEAAADKTTQAIEKQEKALKGLSAVDVYAIGESFRRISDGIKTFSQPGAKFETQLLNVSAITGVTGDALDDLGEAARKSAIEFGSNAANQLDSYKTILSRLGPDIARVPEAVDAMGKSVQTLSKTMENDAVGATNALTTAMLQYQVDLQDPIAASEEMNRMMNVMAAGAKYGAAEVPQIGQALEQAGVSAKLANLSFEEVNAAIQAMATGGKYGSEAGIAIRNVITQISAPGALSKDAVNILKAYNISLKEISDTSVPFADRLSKLKPLQQDINALTEIFGRENSANAQILIRTAKDQAELAQQITGTNTATEQANVVMGSFEERMNRWSAWMDDVKISIFNATESFLPFIGGAADSIAILANLANAKQGLTAITSALSKVTWVQNIATKALTAGQWLLNAAFVASPIGWVVVGLGALTVGVVAAWKHFEGFRAVIYGVWETCKTVFNNIKDLFKAVFSPIGDAITAIKDGRWGDAAMAFAELNPISTAARTLSYVKDGGLTKGVSDAYARGAAAGRASFQDDHKKADDKSPLAIDAVTGNNANATTPAILPGGNSSKNNALSIGGAGSGGGGKSIVMHLNFKNYFTVANNLDVVKIADSVVGRINDRLREQALSL